MGGYGWIYLLAGAGEVALTGEHLLALWESFWIFHPSLQLQILLVLDKFLDILPILAVMDFMIGEFIYILLYIEPCFEEYHTVPLLAVHLADNQATVSGCQSWHPCLRVDNTQNQNEKEPDDTHVDTLLTPELCICHYIHNVCLYSKTPVSQTFLSQKPALIRLFFLLLVYGPFDPGIESSICMIFTWSGPWNGVLHIGCGKVRWGWLGSGGMMWSEMRWGGMKWGNLSR